MRISVESIGDGCFEGNERMRNSCFGMERTKKLYSVQKLKGVVGLMC